MWYNNIWFIRFCHPVEKQFICNANPVVISNELFIFISLHISFMFSISITSCSLILHQHVCYFSSPPSPFRASDVVRRQLKDQTKSLTSAGGDGSRDRAWTGTPCPDTGCYGSTVSTWGRTTIGTCNASRANTVFFPVLPLTDLLVVVFFKASDHLFNFTPALWGPQLVTLLLPLWCLTKHCVLQCPSQTSHTTWSSDLFHFIKLTTYKWLYYNLI